MYNDEYHPHCLCTGGQPCPPEASCGSTCLNGLHTACSTNKAVRRYVNNYGETIDELLLIWAASQEDEYVDRIAYLPIT